MSRVKQVVVSFIVFGLLVAVAAGLTPARLSAANCQSWSGSYDFISLSYCGEYPYEDNALGDMRGKAAYYAQVYYFQGGVYSDPYWWARVTGFEDPAYYDSYWAVCSWGNCY